MSDSNHSNDLRLPKSILKNKSRSRFDSDHDSHSTFDERRSTTSFNPVKSDSTWGSERYRDTGPSRTLRAKIGDFIDQKGSFLFRPLGDEEKFVNEVKGSKRFSEDHHGVAPSLDHFLSLEPTEIRHYIIQNAQVGDIVIGTVASKSTGGLGIKLICRDGGKQAVLEDLGIKAFCPAHQLISMSNSRDENRLDGYNLGDCVRCEILEVPKTDSDKLLVGMKGVTLSAEKQLSYQLGVISKYELPRQFVLAAAESESRSRRSYEEVLRTSRGFSNPSNVSHLASGMGIFSNRNSLMTGLQGTFPKEEMALQLRRVQNAKWAHGNVAEGIRQFKQGNYTEAFQELNKALLTDPENVEGLVARGALYANNANYEKAIQDFEAGLKSCPTHFNARKYLAETLIAFGREKEVSNKLDEALELYSRCWTVRPDHKEAREVLWLLHCRVDKIDMSKLSISEVTTINNVKDKLKLILQNELQLKVDGKSLKKRKKAKDRRNSSDSDDSVSSSSDSSSDSDSSDSGSERKRKKKKKKNKSKKSKKRKSDQSIKAKEASLSPLSKREANQPYFNPISTISNIGAGADVSILGSWSKPTFGVEKDSEDESKKRKAKEKKHAKKSKEKRKKKKRSSSSSTDSDQKNKRKYKKEESSGLTNILPDFGDLEEKLSAYYSKLEKEKVEPVMAPQSVKVTVERSLNDFASFPEVRKIEVNPETTFKSEITDPKMKWGEEKPPGKFELRTDDYGNFMYPNIVRTVVNNPPPVVVEQQPVKFEMKFRGPPAPVPPPASAQSELGSKWRIVGSSSTQEYKLSRPDGSSVFKNPLEDDKEKKNETEDRKPENRKKDEKNFRGRGDSRSRSRSLSRSRSRSKSRSRSLERRRRPRSNTRSYSRSRSRSRSLSPRGRSFRRPRQFQNRYHPYQQQQQQGYRNHRGGRGQGNPRFFRGYNSSVRRPFTRGGYGGQGQGSPDHRSKFRNTFSRTPSVSPKRGERSSRSPRRSNRERDHRRSPSSKSPTKTIPSIPDSKHRREDKDAKNRSSSDLNKSESDAVAVKAVSATAEMEKLLDKRNAEKKEEMRKSNPDFFLVS